ncbi:MAG: hypothetical protein WED04_10435 [Promethearchaeati archaeon SRVP18_Atabeyarchaeia-1]
MARCPNCGIWLWHPTRYSQEVVCPGCGAILERKASLGGFFLNSVEVVDCPRASRHSTYVRDPSYRSDEIVPQTPSRELGEATLPETEDNEDEDEEEPKDDSYRPLYADRLEETARQEADQEGPT